MTGKGTVEASNGLESDASLLSQQLDRLLSSADSFPAATWVRLAIIPSINEALRDLGTHAFVVLHLFSLGGQHAAEVAELLRLIKRLEKVHTKVQGVFISPHLATTLPYNVSRWCTTYLNMCVVESSFKDA